MVAVKAAISILGVGGLTVAAVPVVSAYVAPQQAAEPGDEVAAAEPAAAAPSGGPDEDGKAAAETSDEEFEESCANIKMWAGWAQECEAGDLVACDDLALSANPETTYWETGLTCGGLREPDFHWLCADWGDEPTEVMDVVEDEFVEVPFLLGMQMQHASERVRSAGLTVDGQTFVGMHNGYCDVTYQDPAAGELVSPGRGVGFSAYVMGGGGC